MDLIPKLNFHVSNSTISYAIAPLFKNIFMSFYKLLIIIEINKHIINKSNVLLIEYYLIKKRIIFLFIEYLVNNTIFTQINLTMQNIYCLFQRGYMIYKYEFHCNQSVAKSSQTKTK